MNSEGGLLESCYIRVYLLLCMLNNRTINHFLVGIFSLPFQVWLKAGIQKHSRISLKQKNTKAIGTCFDTMKMSVGRATGLSFRCLKHSGWLCSKNNKKPQL